MEIEILFRPSYSLGVIKLAPDEQIRMDAGAMISMTQGISIETKATGGFLKSLTRAALGGEVVAAQHGEAVEHAGEEPQQEAQGREYHETPFRSLVSASAGTCQRAASISAISSWRWASNRRATTGARSRTARKRKANLNRSSPRA